MPKFQDLTGMKFGEWTVIERVDDYIVPSGQKYTQYKCVCSCGTIKNVLGTSLRTGRSSSCGCKHRAIAREQAREQFTTHGESKTRLYKIWAYMLKRCNNKHASNYSNYGGRGIKVCDEWSDFLCFKEWALSNGYNDNLSIDRIDVDADYCPDNCRWADVITQSNNRRNNLYVTYDNDTHTVAEWARIYNIPYRRLYERIRKNGNVLTAEMLS